MKLALFLLLLLFTAPISAEPKYDLCVTAMFRNEAPYIKEWIEYHKLVGVQHFYLFNNLSTDDFRSVLDPYIKAGVVELIEWPFESKGEAQLMQRQQRAYSRAIKKCIGKTRWLAIIDLDEFIVPVHKNNLVDLLNTRYKRYSGVMINWQLYGTSNVPSIPKGKLMIETLLYKALPNHVKHQQVKSIVRPEHVKKADLHRCEFKQGYFAVYANKNRSLQRSEKLPIDIIRINHYCTRDEAYYKAVKLPRLKKHAPYRINIFSIDKLSLVYDDVILRFVEPLKKVMSVNTDTK